MMTYPGAHEPVSTIQWEGYREACDDLRYMHTLEVLLEKDDNPEIGIEIQDWVNSLQKQGLDGTDIDSIRRLIVYYIEALTAAEN
jgi:hypothetical protein